MIFLALLAALLAAGVGYQALGVYRDSRRYPAPGRIIHTGCVRLHLHEQGTGSPAVLLESGIAATSLSWALVQPHIAEFTRVVSFDRAGLGWSVACREPRTVFHLIDETRALLSCAGIPYPFILVGHSFGGLLIRAYAHSFPDEVAGLVFVDPVSLHSWANCSPEDAQRLKAGAKLSRRGALLARIGVVRVALAALALGGRWFPKLVARASAGQGKKVLEGLVGEVQKLPPSVWPLVRAHWSRPGCFRAMAAYLESLPANAQAALRMSIPSQIPFIVLSASNATQQELQERDSWVRDHQRGQHIRIENSGHWLQLEKPEIVIAAVRQLFDAITSPG